jgi:hypothetical protein
MMMTKLGLIGAALLSLAVAAPAVAATVRNDELPTGYYGNHQVTHQMRAQDFDHFNFGIARPTYHSGWGGPYGDGDYPGTIDQNLGPPYSGSR